MIEREVVLVASGDLRPAANQMCWPAQAELEENLSAAFRSLGVKVKRGHPYKAAEGHGFLASQREGMDAFASIDPDAPLVVAVAAWQYSHHVLAGLTTHKGPILTVANWSGRWPGLVGMLNLNGSLTKAGVAYSTLWSEAFNDDLFLNGLKEWGATGMIAHDMSHVAPFSDKNLEDPTVDRLVSEIGKDLKHRKTILGVFDEGCMGMYNAIVPDDLLMQLGMFKERLSQSALYYATTQVSDEDAKACFSWMTDKGMKFHFGHDEATELTQRQVLLQCKMYVAAARLADDFGCEAIGIQYQQGLKDLLPASDLAEGLLNNSVRPPVLNRHGRVIRDGEPIVHFNEVDECAAIDGIFTNRIHRSLKQPVETTLHDIRWGYVDPDLGEFVWTFEISGAAPPAHHDGDYSGTDSHRQPSMYFHLGGGTVRGTAKAGEIIWSRIYVADGRLKMDIGRGKAVQLSEEETQKRWRETTSQWPMMSAILYGVSRDQMMARHKANHIQVAYGESAGWADRLALAKGKLARSLGIEVHWCGKPPVLK